MVAPPLFFIYKMQKKFCVMLKIVYFCKLVGAYLSLIVCFSVLSGFILAIKGVVNT